MQKITLIACVICLSAIITQAQNLPINVSYFGESGLHPGLKVGVEYGLWEKDKTKNRWLFNRNDKIGPKVKTKALFAAGNLGFYNHANNHTGIFVTTEIGYRRTKHRKGSFLETSLGIGYLQRIYNIDTYEAGSTEPFTGGQGQFLTTFSVGFGRDLSFRRDLPISWYVKPNLLLARQAHTFVPNAALEIGLRYKM
ncbi:MAG: hypothetical protein AB8G11_14005 [Saprospiraceae bacterium]